MNTWLGVVCLNQEEYSGKVRYSKEALKAALDLGNMFYKNMALCDISTGYLFLNQLDSALYYAQAAYEAALADSVPQQLPFIYTNLGSIYSQKGEPTKALDYINKSISLRPAKDTVRILSLYGAKLELFGKLGQYDSAYHYFQKVISSPNPSSVADAYNNMAKIYHKMGRASEPILCYNASLNYPIPYASIVILRKLLHCKSFTNTTALGGKPVLAHPGCGKAA